MSEKKKKIIIDTDCGSDDAMAIAMALNDPAYQIELITTVSGNVDVEQAITNTLTTIEYANTYVPPVYRGSEKMLINELAFAHETHGRDGMGDIGLAPERLKATPGNGILKMLEALRESEDGEIDIIALGPLTNIAIAIRLDYKAIKKAGRIVIMGTAGLGRGNVSPVAEFNIWQDAEAAKIVTESGLENIIYVGWDACLGECMLMPMEIETIRNGSKLGKFTIDCNRQLMELNRVRFGDNYLDMADPAAMAAALYPECIAECEKYYCEVEISNGPSYGAMLVDVNRFSGKEPNVYICSKLHADIYKNYIYKTLQVCNQIPSDEVGSDISEESSKIDSDISLSGDETISSMSEDSRVADIIMSVSSDKFISNKPDKSSVADSGMSLPSAEIVNNMPELNAEVVSNMPELNDNVISNMPQLNAEVVSNMSELNGEVITNVPEPNDEAVINNAAAQTIDKAQEAFEGDAEEMDASGWIDVSKNISLPNTVDISNQMSTSNETGESNEMGFSNEDEVQALVDEVQALMKEVRFKNQKF